MNCPNCGKEIESNEKFCTGCGTKLAGGEQETQFNGMPMNNITGNGILDWFKNLVMGVTGKGVNLRVRRYFFGFGDIVLLTVILWFFTGYKVLERTRYGGLEIFNLLFFGVVTIILIAVICIDIYSKIIGIGKGSVDKAVSESIENLKKRAQTKFNVDISQISEVEPIVVSGKGEIPTGIGNEVKRRHFIKLAKLRSKDPIEAYRIGTDRIFRSLLIQTTVYAFTDTQLLTYSGNIDIATGVVYDEEVSETFYKDINSVTQRDILRKFKAGILKKEYYILKYLFLDVCGVSKLASFDSRLTKSGIEASLAGMESYIREKKF